MGQTWNQHDPGYEQQQDAVQSHTLFQYDDEDLCIHQSGIQQPRPHKQQAAQEVAVVTEAYTLAKKDAVVIPP